MARPVMIGVASTATGLSGFRSREATLPARVERSLVANEPTVLLLAGRDLERGLDLEPIVAELRSRGIQVKDEPLRLGHLLFTRLDLVPTLPGLEALPSQVGLERCGAELCKLLLARRDRGEPISASLRMPRRLDVKALVSAFTAKGYRVQIESAAPDSKDLVVNVHAKGD